MDFGALHLNSERIAFSLILPIAALYIFLNKRFYFSLPSAFYVGWALCALLSMSLTQDPGAHVNGLLISISPLLYFFVFMQNSFTGRKISFVLEYSLWFLSIGSITIYSIWLVSGNFSEMIDFGRIKFTMAEPNILGSAIAIMMLSHLPSAKFSFSHILLHALSLISLIISGSKAPIIAYVIAIIYYMFRSKAFVGIFPLIAAMFCSIMVLSVSIFMTDQIESFYDSMFDRPAAVNIRMYVFDEGWRRFLNHPIIGNGPLDFSFANPAILERMGATDSRALWLWQMWLAIAHDEGIIGLILFLFFIIGTWIHCERLIRLGQREYIGYMAAVIAAVVASQTTTIHLTAIFGVALGLANSRPNLMFSRSDLITPTSMQFRPESNGLPPAHRISNGGVA